MKKSLVWIIIAFIILIMVLVVIFIKPENKLLTGQQISLVLKEKISNFTCVPEIGNFGSRVEYYEIWKGPNNNPYILHTETHLTIKHPPEDIEGNTTITKYFDTSLSNEIVGIVKEEDMNYCDNRDFSKYNFCNTTASTCLVIAKS